MNRTERTRAAWLVAVLAGATLLQPVAADAVNPITLGVGETQIVGGLSITYAAVLGDSRCPIDVVCIWEGNAESQLRLSAPSSEPALPVLNTSPMFATKTTYAGYQVQLLYLEPQPVSTQWPAPEDYKLTILVTGGGSPTPVETSTWGKIKALYGEPE